MATLGPLILKMTADASGIQSGLAQARNLIVGAAGTLGAGFSLNALKDFVANQFRAVDEVGKLSDRLGIQTEALIGLQHAAELANISSEELTQGIEKMLRSFQGAESAEQAFKLLSDRVRAMASPFDRARIATEFFGRSGQRLLPLLLEGSEGIKRLQKEAESLGLTFSRLDAKNIEDLNDALTRLQAAATGAGRQVAVGLANVFTQKIAPGVVTQALSGVNRTLVLGAARLASAWEDVSKSADKAKVSMRQAQAVAIGPAATGAQLDFSKEQNNIIAGLERQAEEFGKTSDEIALYRLEMTAADAETMKVAQSLIDQKKAAEEAGDAFESMFADLTEAARKSREAADGAMESALAENEAIFERGRRTFESTRSPMEQYLARMRELQEELQNGAIDQETFGRAAAKAAAELEGGATKSIAAAERRFTFSTPSDRRSDPAEIAKRQEKLAAASLKEEQKSNGFLNTIAQKVAAGDSVGIFTITNN